MSPLKLAAFVTVLVFIGQVLVVMIHLSFDGEDR